MTTHTTEELRAILKQYEQVDGNTTFLNAEKGITFEIYYPNGNKYGEIKTVASHHDEYVKELNALSKKEQKKLLNKKFEQRIIKEKKKESFLNRLFER